MSDNDRYRITSDTPDGGDVDLETEIVELADGARLTSARADEIVAEVRSKVGRPSLTAPGQHSPPLNLRVSDATKARLVAVARAQRRRQSDVVREALEEYLARH